MRAGYKNESWANDDIEHKRRDMILELKPKGTTTEEITNLFLWKSVLYSTKDSRDELH